MARVVQGLAAAVLGVLLAASPARGDDTEKAAAVAAEAWLAHVDAARYGASWDEAAKVFRGAVTRAQWEQAARGVRGPLGKLRSRTLASTTYTRSLPGAPDGEYVVLQYRTSFEHKREAVETVTPMRDPDGRWRVSGYYVR